MKPVMCLLIGVLRIGIQRRFLPLFIRASRGEGQRQAASRGYAICLIWVLPVQ
jgi:hypothetical protein